MPNSASRAKSSSDHSRNGKPVGLRRETLSLYSKTDRAASRRSNSKPTPCRVTTPRSDRTRNSVGKPPEVGFLHGFLVGFLSHCNASPVKTMRCKPKRSKPGRGQKRGKGGSDPTFAALRRLRSLRASGVAPALSIPCLLFARVPRTSSSEKSVKERHRVHH